MVRDCGIHLKTTELEGEYTSSSPQTENTDSDVVHEQDAAVSFEEPQLLASPQGGSAVFRSARDPITPSPLIKFLSITALLLVSHRRSEGKPDQQSI
jgi:hypothetical protein